MDQNKIDETAFRTLRQDLPGGLLFFGLEIALFGLLIAEANYLVRLI